MIQINAAMSGKERVTAAINFAGPDRVPHKHCFLPATVKRYPELISLLRKYPSDFAGEEYREGLAYDPSGWYRPGRWTDCWGCVWTNLIEGIMGQVTVHPLDDYKKLKNYRWPRAAEANISAAENISNNRGDKYLLLDGGMTFFERLVDLRGFENAMCDIAERPPEFYEICDQIVRYNLDMIDRLLALEPDGIYLSDDWGSQIALLINPDAWRKLFLPYYTKMFAPVRRAGKHVFFHTDGYTIQILPDLANAGVQVFWADLTVNPLGDIQKILGGKVCFWGLTDVQFVMRQGNPAEVKKHGVDLLRALADYNGGFIACSEADPDQPWENIKMIYETFYQFGKYPLKL